MPPLPIPASASPDLVAARDAAVVCDLSPIAIVEIAGADAAAFLQGQLSSDVNGLAVDGVQYTSYNSPGGRMLANFTLWRDGPLSYRALLPEDVAGPVAQRLRMFVLRAKVQVTDITASLARCGVGGPRATAAIRAATGLAPAPFCAERSAEMAVLAFPGPRYLVFAPVAEAATMRAALADVAHPAGWTAWQWLLVHAGLPVITSATQDRFVPQTANWDALGGIHFQKGCYTGQEIIARTQYLGRLKERLFAFHVAQAAIVPGTRLFSPVFADQACGTVVNTAPAVDGGADFLAVLQLAAAASGDVRLGAIDGPRLTPLPLPYTVPAPTQRARADSTGR